MMRSGPRGEGKSARLWERSDIRALRDSRQWRRKSNTYLCFEKDAVLRGSTCRVTRRPIRFHFTYLCELKDKYICRSWMQDLNCQIQTWSFLAACNTFILHKKIMCNLQCKQNLHDCQQAFFELLIQVLSLNKNMIHFKFTLSKC